MNKNKMIIAIAGIGVVAIGGYFAYKYLSASQAATLAAQRQQTASAQQTDNLNGISSLLDTVTSSGGLSGIIGSIF